ncbi:MAG: hypothetical protein J0L82_18970 [Deltaproteobacteria bacterium]|jgi:hypothetical protein|nr:hypothetical protein [Deltaproteobacteria bacterium]
MMKYAISLISFIAVGCAHSPKCGNPEGARVIFAGEKSCTVRIRQVTMGTELKIPQSLKGAALADFMLEWVEPTLESGRIELGHFVLISSSAKEPSR